MGDPLGMPVSHALASGMGGIRTAGDLVARMQLHRKMRLPEAKRYVAERLNVGLADLSDEVVMREVREDLGLGVVTAMVGAPTGLAAKARIGRLLDVRIGSVELYRERMAAGD